MLMTASGTGRALAPLRSPSSAQQRALFSTPRGAASVPHSRRCRPVAFKEGDKNDEIMQRRKAEEEVRMRQEAEQAERRRLEALDQQMAREMADRLKEITDAAERVHQQQQGRLEQSPEELRQRVLKEGNPSSLGEVKQAIQQGKAPSYSAEAPRVSLLVPAFTRRREVFVGRIAMVGFFAACLWETLLPEHPGIIRQVSTFSGLNPSTVATLFLGLIAFNFFASLAPWSPTFSLENLRDVSKRPPGPPNAFVSPLNWKQFLGISDWGFTKRNELFHGRLAMLGFLAALLQEVRLGGPGPLAQIAYYLNLAPDDGFYSTMASPFFAFVGFAITLAYLRGNVGSVVGEEDIY